MERALIDEFLHGRGYDVRALSALPEDQPKRLFAEACVFAANELAEVAACAHYVHELHGDK